MKGFHGCYWRFDLGLGASVSFNGRLSRRLPLTLRLAGAMLRGERYLQVDAEQLGIDGFSQVGSSDRAKRTRCPPRG